MRKKRYQSPKAPAFTRVNTAAERDLTPSAAYGSFSGAMPSTDRGYIYFPEVDSEREIDSWSRNELAKRACAMYNEIGFVRGMINGIARMTCGTGLMPQALTANEDWNDRIERLANERLGSRNTFHLARKFDLFSSQRAVYRSMLKVGDVLGVLARTPDTNALRVALYEGNQIGNGSRDSKGWLDGVLPDQHKAALKYRLLERASDGKTTQVDVPAEHCMLVADYERIGQHRGITALYHAVNRLLDRGEILAAVTKGIKLSNQIGYVIETDKDTPGPSGGPGALAPRKQTIIQTSSGPMTMEKFLAPGQIEELKPGQSFKILHDERPHPNVVDHLDGLVRDVALGTGWFPEVLYKVAGLGGANTRFVMAATQGKIEEGQELLVETYLAPIWIAFVADMIAGGEIEFVPDWYAHGWLSPARLTVDFGRDGKLHIEQYKQGMITLKTLYGYRGEEWRRQTMQYLAERAFMKEEARKRNLTLQEAYPQFFGINAGAQPSGNDKPDTKDDTEDDDDDA
jgi:capsid protein